MWYVSFLGNNVLHIIHDNNVARIVYYFQTTMWYVSFPGNNLTHVISRYQLQDVSFPGNNVSRAISR